MTQNDIAARPELSAEERTLRDIVKRIRKLRWIGSQRSNKTLDIELGAVVLNGIEQSNGRWRVPHRGGQAHLAAQPAPLGGDAALKFRLELQKYSPSSRRPFRVARSR